MRPAPLVADRPSRGQQLTSNVAWIAVLRQQLWVYSVQGVFCPSNAPFVEGKWSECNVGKALLKAATFS